MTPDKLPLNPLERHHTTAADAVGAADVLRALTALVSRWTSHDFQQQVAASSDVALDPTAIRALYVLGHAGGSATPSTVAQELHLSRPSTSKLLTRLSDAGLLERNTQLHDRRSVTVALTPQGRASYDELFGAGLDMITAATLHWEPADREALHRLLPRFLSSLTAPPPQ